MSENGNGNGVTPTIKWLLGLVITLGIAANATLFTYTAKAHSEVSRMKEIYVEYKDLDSLRKDLEHFKDEIRADIKANTREVTEIKGMIKGMRKWG